MIELGKYKFTKDIDYFIYVMRHYFRKVPPIPTNIYLNSAKSLDTENRILLAKYCRFPSIINTLARDKNYDVREMARKNDFWILIGQLQDVLGFGKIERREFARQEVFRIIIILLMFEDDLSIIREVLRNGSVSTKMITIYMQLLQERGRGKKDQQILQEAEKVLAEKKMRIVKAAEIRNAQKFPLDKEQQLVLLSKLADEDRAIAKTAANIIFDTDPAVLHKLIKLATTESPNDKILSQFVILSQILKVVKKRDDIAHASTDYLNMEKSELNGNLNRSITDYFSFVINRKRRLILHNSKNDLTNFQHILLLAHCHCDIDPEIRNIAQNIISLDDLFTLVSDLSTPQHLFKEILHILSEHPSETIRKRALITFQDESKRLWNRLKELEQSLNAYFDIIFQSLGFEQINEYNIALKSIYEADKTIHRYLPQFDKTLKQKVKLINSDFDEIKGIFKKKINSINSDTSMDTIEEIIQIYSMMHQIIELKNFGLEGLRPGLLKDLDPELRNKARTIWQSALGPFLGRIKHLNEMIKIKFFVLAADYEEKEVLQKEFKEVIESMENEHKNMIDCKLTTSCTQCRKRGCAAERFLGETEFFIQELLDNFVED